MNINIYWSLMLSIGVGLLVAILVYAAGGHSHVASLVIGALVALFLWSGLWWFGGREPEETAPRRHQPHH
ncbi:MAG TPA: hypothetical protein VIL46_06985 [Gemmataceae bacterium]